MNFILKNWVKYCTKETVKTLKLVTIGSAIIITIACIKYKPVYKVTISGETIGFVENRKIIEAKIDNYMNETTGNVVFREIEIMPEFVFQLVDREKTTEEKEIMLAVEDLTTTTYKTYIVTANGETKAEVATQEEAEKIIDNIKEGLNEEIDLKFGIVENYCSELKLNSVDEATNSLNEIKLAKVSEYEAQKAEEAKKAKKAEEARLAKARQISYASTTTLAASGSINGMSLTIPVNGSISSRFGTRSSSRSTVHTGLDISAPSGTGIKSIAAGTVTYAAYRGSYGNLIIIDHGNGIQSYYAHCSAICVSVGQCVNASTIVGAVGSTGNSTGPHLHLEIRVNGNPVNPQNYIY